MQGAACPKCGVAITPGYVRCPKCRAPLPATARVQRASVGPGGTAVPDKPRFPWGIVLFGIAMGMAAFVTFVALPAFEDYRRPRTHRDAGAAAVEVTPEPSATPTPAPTPALTQPTGNTAPVGPSPQAVASELERSLKRKRLWSTVQIIGDHADIRSGSCKDPALTAEVDAVLAALKTAGTSRLRCLEQSGTVVFQRDL